MAFWNGCQYAYPRQNVEYAEIEKAMGRTPVYVVGEVSGDVVCVAIFSIRPLFFANKFSLEAYCLRGPAFHDVSYCREFVQKVISYCKTLGVGSVHISPLWHFSEAQEVLSVLDDIGFVPYYPREGSRSDTGRVDLSPSEDEILASLSKSTRYHIRRAEKLGVDIRPITHFDEMIPAYRCLVDMQAKRGLTQLTLKEFTTLFQYVLSPGEYGIHLNAYLDKEFLVTVWILRGPLFAIVSGYAVDSEVCRRVAGSLTVRIPSLVERNPVGYSEGLFLVRCRGIRSIQRSVRLPSSDL